VAIVAPATPTPLPDGAVGEVWVSGPSVAQGYWNRPEETARNFGAVRTDGASGFLRTGDLGYLRDSELFVTGRLKDLVILEGRNIYPHDVERTIQEAHPGIRPGGVAAFAVTRDDRERLTAIAEVDRDLPDDVLETVRRQVQEAVAQAHEAPLTLLLVTPGQTPKTSSGKLRRAAARDAYLAGTLEAR
jgi:acyl-CoA synthetase (AMP-forming)/AMP-acid ligase II